MRDLLAWALATEIVGLAVLPLLRVFFGNRRDAALLCRPIGLAVVAYVRLGRSRSRRRPSDSRGRCSCSCLLVCGLASWLVLPRLTSPEAKASLWGDPEQLGAALFWIPAAVFFLIRAAGPGHRRAGEVHGPRVPELARAVPGNAAGGPVDVGTDDQLLLLGIPARGRPGQGLQRRADGRLQPRHRLVRRLLVLRGGVPRPAPVARRPARRARRRRRNGVRREPGGGVRRLERAARARLRLLPRVARDRGGQHDQRVPVLHVLPRGPPSPPARVPVLHRGVRRRAPLDGEGPRRLEGRSRHAVGTCSWLSSPGRRAPRACGTCPPSRFSSSSAPCCGRPAAKGFPRSGPRRGACSSERSWCSSRWFSSIRTRRRSSSRTSRSRQESPLSAGRRCSRDSSSSWESGDSCSPRPPSRCGRVPRRRRKRRGAAETCSWLRRWLSRCSPVSRREDRPPSPCSCSPLSLRRPRGGACVPRSPTRTASSPRS